MNTLLKIVKLMRPEQQIKSGAVVLGALASGKVNSLDSVLDLASVTILWVCLSSAVYIFNDICDLEKDREHPKKSKRPLASGEVSIKFSRRTLATLLAINLVFFPMIDIGVSICAGLYICLNIAYSAKLKNFVVVDILIVCSGFVLRGLSGVLIVKAEPSLWFILLSLFGSLLLVSGKRFAQKIQSEGLGTPQRSTITHYPLTFLRQIQTISSSGLIISYIMMTQEKTSIDSIQEIILEMTIVPFLSTILFINYYQHTQNEEEVVSLVVSKKPIFYSAIAWFTLFTLSLFDWGE
jgi:decaprenyl-phosphate phosphoribosyltransferase